ncbi:MAG: amidohydrolase family protein [Pseudomonadota bacterium]
MAHDIVIRGGQITDGTGAEPIRGDLAIDDGVITVVGKVDSKGDEEIDAEGHIVSPGFIDLHTHFDAQIGWDPALTPVSWHGVTTVLMGNCGMSFAPCKPADRDLLAGMMETVEDIPRQSILTGLPWDWEDYGSYLDSIEQLRPGLNIAGMVGHVAVRYYVMGERSVEDQATEDELKRMAQIVGQSIDSGAVGFSTNRFERHVMSDGRSVPGTFADPRELEIIAKEIGARDALMQAAAADAEVLQRLSDVTQGRILTDIFRLGQTEPDSGKATAANLDELCTGRDITALTQVRGSGAIFGLQSTIPFVGDTWRKLKQMSFDDRLSAINTSETFDKLVIEGKQEGACRIPTQRLYYLGSTEVPDYGLPDDQSLDDVSKAKGEHFVETFLRLTKQSNGLGLWNFRTGSMTLDELGALFQNRNIYPSLGDAGAHVSQIMDAGWSSFVLSYWMRERQIYSMGEGIRRLTGGPARVLGLKDRGTLAVGQRADVNVFDFANVSELQPTLVHDFPGGAPRYIQKARGYKATIVNGQINVRDDELTGARAGHVLRHGR